MTEPSSRYVPANTSGSRSIVIITCLFTLLAALAVVGRIQARRIKKLRLGIDDVLIIVALVPLFGHGAAVLITVYLGGVGHPSSTLQPGNIVTLFKTLVTIQFLFSASLGLTKASIVYLLMRIFSHIPKFRVAGRCVLVYVFCWTLMCMLIAALLCRPFAKNWDRGLPGSCGNLIVSHTFIAALDILGNLMIIALPMPWIFTLHTNRTAKIGLCAIFALGFLDVVVGILRVIYLADLILAPDYPLQAVNTWIWSTLEPCLAVIVACGPTFQPLLQLILGTKPNSGYGARGADSGSSTRTRDAASNQRPHKLATIGFGNGALSKTSHAERTESVGSDDEPMLRQYSGNTSDYSSHRLNQNTRTGSGTKSQSNFVVDKLP